MVDGWFVSWNLPDKYSSSSEVNGDCNAEPIKKESPNYKDEGFKIENT